MTGAGSSAERHVLVVRLDSLGDVLISGPAIRAVAAGATRTSVLTSPASASAAALLPGVDDVLTWSCPWIVASPDGIDPADIASVVEQVRAARVDEALILTSYHQSALPTALLLRLAGVPRISAVSDDYPGSLLDVRLPSPPDAPEPERMLAIARGAGFDLPVGDGGGLEVRLPTRSPGGLPAEPFVVVHPGAAAPARRYPADRWREVVTGLTARGWIVLVTGSAAEHELTAEVASGAVDPRQVQDCAGRFDVAGLAWMLSRAAVVAVANTGPAHLAAAVGTPVVSLFAPVVPLERWGPYTSRRIVLGDQSAACRDSRAVDCPVPAHPCLATVSAADVVDAVASLAAHRHLTVAAAT